MQHNDSLVRGSAHKAMPPFASGASIDPAASGEALASDLQSPLKLKHREALYNFTAVIRD